jgi:glc operon protein GlcG
MRQRAASVSVASVLIALFLAGAGWGEPLQKKSISLEDARKAASAAAEEAKKNKWNMAIAIVDDGGMLVYFERIDETQFGSIDIAIGKARTAASLKRPTKALEDALNKGQHAILSFPNILPREGGVPIFADGKVVGAIGVSGGTSSEDAQVATAGVDSLKK